MTIPDNFLIFAYPDDILNGTIVNAGGRVMYTLTTEEHIIRSDITTITRPDKSTVALIQWGSAIGRSAQVVLTDSTVPAKEYLAEAKADSLGGQDSEVFRDQEGNEYYWRDCEVSRFVR